MAYDKPMNVQQANFIKDLLKNKASLNQIAEKFYFKYGESIYCGGPSSFYFDNGRKVYTFSAIDGHDLKNAASDFLHEKL